MKAYCMVTIILISLMYKGEGLIIDNISVDIFQISF